MSRPRAAAPVATLARLSLVGTLAAGALGLLRQRREVAQERSGSPVIATDGAGRLHRRLSRWLPTRPRSRAGRVVAGVWAGPLTIVGVALAALGGGRRRWDPVRGCWIVEGVGGPSAVALRAVGAEANAVGHIVLSRRDPAPASLLDHEAVHVRQAERLGPLLLPVYVWLGARYGYRDHPLERAARAGARAAIADGSSIS